MRNMKKMIALVLVLTMCLGVSNMSYASEIKSTNLLNYPINSQERFIASIANEKNISYDEAEKYFELKLKNISRSPLEEMKYETVDKVAKTIRTNSGDFKVRIATEVAYLYNNVTDKPIEIISVGSPYAYIYGYSNAEFNHSDYNVTSNKYSARISVTGSFVITTSSSYSIGFDIIGVSGSFNNILTTKAVTPVIDINLSDL
jgi:hypothetical protein